MFVTCALCMLLLTCSEGFSVFKKLPMQIATRSRFSSQANLQSTAFTDEDLDLPQYIQDANKVNLQSTAFSDEDLDLPQYIQDANKFTVEAVKSILGLVYKDRCYARYV